jgi:hypothetical protein
MAARTAPGRLLRRAQYLHDRHIVQHRTVNAIAAEAGLVTAVIKASDVNIAVG